MPQTVSTEAAQAAPPDDSPSVGGVKVRPALTLGLYAVLALSGGAALWAQRNPHEVPGWVARAAPWAFLVFAVGFAGYRLALVAARRYSAFKAFFQIGIAFTAFFLLLKPAFPVGPTATGSAALPELLRDRNATVRALAAELSRHRPEGRAAAPLLIDLLADEDPAVRTAAHQSLVGFNDGTDLGTQPQPWKERFP